MIINPLPELAKPALFAARAGSDFDPLALRSLGGVHPRACSTWRAQETDMLGMLTKTKTERPRGPAGCRS